MLYTVLVGVVSPGSWASR